MPTAQSIVCFAAPIIVHYGWDRFANHSDSSLEAFQCPEMGPFVRFLLHNIETYLLALAISCYIYSLTYTQIGSNPHVHQYEDFEQLARNNNIVCSNENTSIQKDILEVSADNKTELKPKCKLDSSNLTYISLTPSDETQDYTHILPGGKFQPIRCVATSKIAILIPYRDRAEHLRRFSLYIHQFLPAQSLDYVVYVVEQDDSKPFNRAKLFNVGVKEISKLDPERRCFIFHDVDLLPRDQRNLYICTEWPRHLCPAVSALRYRLLYPTLFGGVTSMTKEQYDTIGGFSNSFYGWGGEDDDIYRKIKAVGMDIDRSPQDIGIYIAMSHKKAKPNPDR